MKEYMQSAQDVLKELGVNADGGLSAAEAEKSRAEHGENQFTREKPKSILRRIWEALCEPMMIILLVALAITIAVQIVSVCMGGEFDWIECVGIVVAVVISVAISVVMEHRSAKAFHFGNKRCEVCRIFVLGQCLGGGPCLANHENVGTCGTCEKVVGYAAFIVQRCRHKFLCSLDECRTVLISHLDKNIQSDHCVSCYVIIAYCKNSHLCVNDDNMECEI